MPCWSSWKTGMSSSARSRSSISKQRGAEMSSRLMPPKPGAIALHDGDDLVGVLRVEAERPGVDAAELLEQQRLALHHRHRRLRPDVAEPEHGGAVGDDGDGVLLDRQVPGRVAVLGDRLADRGRRPACRPSRGRRASSRAPSSCISILPPRCIRNVRSETCSTSTPSTARTRSTIRSRWSRVGGVDGDVADLRALLDADEVDRAERAARLADRAREPGERARRVGEADADRGAERRGDVAHVRITPSAASAAISSVSYPASRSTSAVCSPTAGGADRCSARSPSNESGSAVSLRSGIVGWCERLQHPERLRLRRVRDVGDVGDGRGGHAGLRQPRQPVRRVVARRSARSRIAQSSSRCRTRSGLRRKRGSSTSSGRPTTAQIAAKMPVVAAGDHQLAVARREHLVRRHHREAGALAVRDGAVGEVAGEVVADVAERGLVERDVDDRALAACARARAARRARRARPRCPFPGRSATSRPGRPAGRARRSSRSARPRPASARRSPARR